MYEQLKNVRGRVSPWPLKLQFTLLVEEAVGRALDTLSVVTRVTFPHQRKTFCVGVSYI